MYILTFVRASGSPAEKQRVRQAVAILNQHNLEYSTFDILKDKMRIIANKH